MRSNLVVTTVSRERRRVRIDRNPDDPCRTRACDAVRVAHFQMVDPGVLTYLEELTQCRVCKQKFNDTEQSPKCLSCKHQFCLQCVEKKLVWSGRDVFCADCWSSTKVPDQELDQALPTHSSTLLLANNLSHFKITTNNSSAKSGDKERKVINDVLFASSLASTFRGEKKRVISMIFVESDSPLSRVKRERTSSRAKPSARRRGRDASRTRSHTGRENDSGSNRMML